MVCCKDLFTFTKKRNLFYGQDVLSGIKVWKMRRNDKFEKNILSLKDSSPDSKADISKRKCIWYLEVHIECVAYQIIYLRDDIDCLIFKKAQFQSRVSNRALQG